MSHTKIQIALIRGDGIGVDVSAAALTIVEAALKKTSGVRLRYSIRPT